jgi:hypothetical protein
LNTEINKALHTMTAHLHRYGSELGWLGDIVADISQHHTSYHKYLVTHGAKADDSAGERISLGLLQVTSQLNAVTSFRQELENKTRNILALVSQPNCSIFEFRVKRTAIQQYPSVKRQNGGGQRRSHDQNAPSCSDGSQNLPTNCRPVSTNSIGNEGRQCCDENSMCAHIS